MVDPTKITKFDRTEAELQELILFCICVAGKSALQQSAKLEAFLQALPGSGGQLPFDKIKNSKDTYVEYLKQVKMGQYTRIGKAIDQLVFCDLDLKTCSVERLETIKGIGPKTARFFILHTRKDQRLGVLDTHILSWMRELGYKTPKSTPPLPKYRELEKIFLTEADKRKKDPCTLDLEIWNARHRRINQ